MSVALVIGGAGCVWDDVRQAMAMTRFDGVVACNDVGAVWPGRLDGWATLHPEKMHRWTTERTRNGFSRPGRIVCHHQARHGRLPACVDGTTEHHFEGQTVTGSSGLFAAKMALIDLGFDKAILCGIPMLASPGHFFDARPWNGVTSHRHGWREAMPIIKDRLRSVSGWTAELLGEPDKDWLGS